MARIRIQDENREISDAQEICEFLKPFGIWYENWDVDGRIGAEATNDDILAAYAPEIDRLKNAGGFVTADRKSTRLNSSHRCISYAVFCLKKQKENYCGRL